MRTSDSFLIVPSNSQNLCENFVAVFAEELVIRHGGTSQWRELDTRNSRPQALAGSSGPGLRLLELGISAILVGVLVFASVTRVQSGHVGVLTLFGRVTGEVLPEGWRKSSSIPISATISMMRLRSRSQFSVPMLTFWALLRRGGPHDCVRELPIVCKTLVTCLAPRTGFNRSDSPT